jgi:hypothetical protein
MHKISLNSTIVKEFYTDIKNQFSSGKLRKVEKKKEIFAISYDEIERLIKTKLSAFDSTICFEKIIKADYTYLKSLVDFINVNPKRTALKKSEKEYFFTMYSRLKKPPFIKKLDVKVCPYCNRNYIFNFTKSGNHEATAQLDHFFDKSSYPYLAVSAYNLVPSCSTCNQRKSAKQLDVFYPYTESFNEYAKFEYTLQPITKTGTFFDEEQIKLDIKSIKNSKRVEEHIEVFNLRNLYNEHKDIVSELLVKAEIYNESYIDELFNQYEGTLFKNREDLMRLITCGYITDEEINKRPLSKLIKDISEELELI